MRKMTYRELNAIFLQTWGDERGIIKGIPVELIYKMNRLAKSGDDIVDESLLKSKLEQKGLSLPDLIN